MQRLKLFAAAALFLGRKCAPQNRHKFGWSAQAVIKFVFGVQPAVGQTNHNRMVGRSPFDHKCMLFPVTSAGTWGFSRPKCGVSDP